MELRSDQLIQRIVEQWMLEAEAVVFFNPLLCYEGVCCDEFPARKVEPKPGLGRGGSCC